jgi:hypothetical protein
MEPHRPSVTVQDAQTRRDRIWEKMERLARYPTASNREAHDTALIQTDGNFNEDALIDLTSNAVRRTQALARYLGTVRDTLQNRIRQYGRESETSEIRGILGRSMKEIQDVTNECNDNDKVYLWLRFERSQAVRCSRLNGRTTKRRF